MAGKKLSKVEMDRHNDYRQYRDLIYTIREYENYTSAMLVLFRSKYLKEEILEEANKYFDDDFEEHMIKKKDESFKLFLQEVSLVESKTAHSCMVVRSHKYLKDSMVTQYKWLYHSLEEYLIELYNNGEDFVLYLTHLNELLLKREDEFEYIVPVLGQGEIVLRAMRDNPTRKNPYLQSMYMMYTVLSNPDLYGDGKMFIATRFKGRKPKEIWHLKALKRQKGMPSNK